MIDGMGLLLNGNSFLGMNTPRKRVVLKGIEHTILN